MAYRKPLKNRDARLATVANPTKSQNKKSKMLDSRTKSPQVAHTAGRLGYAQKCKELNIFLKVTVCIKQFRQENPNSTFLDTWQILHSNFPFVFSQDRSSMYSGNVQKMIENEPAWCEAYYAGKEDLIAMAEYRISKILEKDDVKDETIIKAYDTLKKYQVENNNNVATLSDETSQTLDNIQQGLQEMLSGEK